LTRGPGLAPPAPAPRGLGRCSLCEFHCRSGCRRQPIITFSAAAIVVHGVYAAISEFDFGARPAVRPAACCSIKSVRERLPTSLRYPIRQHQWRASLSPINLSGIARPPKRPARAPTSPSASSITAAALRARGMFSTWPAARLRTLPSKARCAGRHLVPGSCHLPDAFGSFTQGDIGDAYTITVTNNGTAPTIAGKRG